MDTEDAELNELVEDYVRSKQALIEMLEETKREINDLIDSLEVYKLTGKHYQLALLSIISMLSRQLTIAAKIKKAAIIIQDNDNES